MLPTDLLLNMGQPRSGDGLFHAAAGGDYLEPWNVWFFGLLASSSQYTLIGAIIGVKLNQRAVNVGDGCVKACAEVTKIFSSLGVSPIVGLVIAGLIFSATPFLEQDEKRDRIHRIQKIAKKKKANVSRHSGRVLPSLFPLRAWRFRTARMTGRKELVL